jgi:hypothetical protein
MGTDVGSEHTVSHRNIERAICILVTHDVSFDSLW